MKEEVWIHEHEQVVPTSFVQHHTDGCCLDRDTVKEAIIYSGYVSDENVPKLLKELNLE